MFEGRGGSWRGDLPVVLGQPRISMRPVGVVSPGEGAIMELVPTRENSREPNLFLVCRTLQFIRLSHHFLNPFSPQSILHYPSTIPILRMRYYSLESLSDSQSYPDGRENLTHTTVLSKAGSCLRSSLAHFFL